MQPKEKAPQEHAVKARTKGLVETFDISDRSEVDDDLSGQANKPSSAISESEIIKEHNHSQESSAFCLMRITSYHHYMF